MELCTELGISKSNGEAKKLIQAGSIYLNEEKIEDMQRAVTTEDFVNGVVLLRKGKKVFKIIKN